MQPPSSSSSTNGMELEDANRSSKSTRKRLSPTSSTVVIGILLTEAMESFSFYGAQIILVMYLRQSLGFSEASSIALFSFLSSFADLTPILGAVLADGWLGRSKTILYFGSISVLGLFITTFGAMLKDSSITAVDYIKQGISDLIVWRKSLSFIGLILLFVGIGCMDPCLSSFGADQVAGTPAPSNAPSPTANSEPEAILDDCENQKGEETTLSSGTDKQQVRVRAYFGYLYFCTNVGAVLSCGVIPLVREHYGFGIAFLVCAFCMLVGLVCFFSKRSQYSHSTSSKDPSTLASTFTLCGKIIGQRLLQPVRKWKCGGVLAQPLWCEGSSPRSNIISILEGGGVVHGKGPSIRDKNATSVDSGCCYGACATDGMDTQLVQDAEQALRVVPIMAMLPMFWMLYDQQESVWILQASRMNLHGLQPEQLNLFNPIQIMIFIPLFDRYVYPALTRCGWKLDPLARMGIGMLLAATAFLVSGGLEFAIERAEAQGTVPPSVFWQLIQITIMSVSEILVAVTGLEFSYSAAPVRLKAFLMAVYSLAKALGDLCGGVLYSTLFQSWNRATVMFVCALLMLLNRVAFETVAGNWYQSSSAMKQPEAKKVETNKANVAVIKLDSAFATASDHPNESSSLLPR